MKDHKAIWIHTEDETLGAESSKQEFFSLPIADAMSADEQAIEENTGRSNRRDFLKYMGFGLGAAVVAAGCETPVRKAIPYITKPDSIVPGVAAYYATSFADGGDYCAVLVKTREARPIKMEGNALSTVTKGGTSARVQAAVLDLYDTARLKGPGIVEDGKLSQISWNELDEVMAAGLNDDSRIAIVSRTVLSPSLEKAVDLFKARYPNARWVQYDPVSASGLLDACEQAFGERIIPEYRFDKSALTVSFGADFLGTWISPVEYAAQFAETRKATRANPAKLSRLVQVESMMSLTGSNADNRILVKPSEQGLAIATLYNEVAGLKGASTVQAPTGSFAHPKTASALRKVAAQLVEKGGQSLVVCGTNNTSEQLLVLKLNHILGNFGETLDIANGSYQRRGSDKDLETLVADMKAGSIDALLVMSANPAYDTPRSLGFADAMERVSLKVSMGSYPDETALQCHYVAPDHHMLESWGDARPKRGSYSLIQPVIAPLFDTRAAGQSLLVWAGSEELDQNDSQPYRAFVSKHWEDVIFPAQSRFALFRSFWDVALHDGVYEAPVETLPAPDYGSLEALNVSGAADGLTTPISGMEIQFYESVAIGHGQQGNNPWLHEMPDPINRCTWGNYLAIPVGWDGSRRFESMNNLKDGDLVELSVDGKQVTLPVIQQFGLAPDTIALALGYGRTAAGPVGNGVGVDVFPMMAVNNGHIRYSATNVSVSNAAGKERDFSCVQYHHTFGISGTNRSGETINVDEKILGYQGSLTDRSIIFQTHIDKVDDFTKKLKKKREKYQKLNSYTLYPGHEKFYEMGHHWGMSIDMNACIGCGACVVACIAENNVPVVGKKEVARHHEMTWLRIDRYYYGDADNPNVIYQPMLCQHCDNAPCENVCPVNATNHSSEGLNQMTYNRCIGTRYCANNCPYKVRRFNWLDYTAADLFPANENTLNDEGHIYMADNLTRMVLNPDVTVRSRGVIEKCSFCVQRIQEGKLMAKKENRGLREQDVKTACQTACPTGAIIFGDQNNKEGSLARLWEHDLNYFVLEEVNVRPSVGYIAKVNNRDENLNA